MTLKYGLEVTHGHWKWYYLKALERFPIRLPQYRNFSHFGDIQRQRMAWPWNLGFFCRSRSFKMAQFYRPCTTFYWSAIVTIALSCTISSYLTLNNIVTLKSGLDVTRGNWNWCHIRKLGCGFLWGDWKCGSGKCGTGIIAGVENVGVSPMDSQPENKLRWR